MPWIPDEPEPTTAQQLAAARAEAARLSAELDRVRREGAREQERLKSEINRQRKDAWAQVYKSIRERGCVAIKIEDLPRDVAQQVLAENRARLEAQGVRFATDEDMKKAGL